MKKQRFKVRDFVVFTGCGLVMLGCSLLYKVMPYRISYNFTDSEDKGFYITHLMHSPKYSVGDLVLVCVPDRQLANISLQRKYLSHGPCQYHTAYEIKQIVATYPSYIHIHENQAIVSKTRIEILKQDSLGKPLNSKLHSMSIPAGYYFVLGKTPNSFDSRYYGLVRAEDIKGLAYPLITWRIS